MVAIWLDRLGFHYSCRFSVALRPLYENNNFLAFDMRMSANHLTIVIRTREKNFALNRSQNKEKIHEKRLLLRVLGGFIGSHLVAYLKERNYWVRAVGVKYPEFETSKADEFLVLDLRRWENCVEATQGMEEVYALAADMGGMGFISSHHAQILHNNSLINIHTLDAARANGVKRYLYTSV